jgi:hypothetical protein
MALAVSIHHRRRHVFEEDEILVDHDLPAKIMLIGFVDISVGRVYMTERTRALTWRWNLLVW